MSVCNTHYFHNTKTMKQIAVNIVCIIVSLLCVIMIIEYPFKNGGGFGLENFIGVMATFIGICATMMVLKKPDCFFQTGKAESAKYEKVLGPDHRFDRPCDRYCASDHEPGYRCQGE